MSNPYKYEATFTIEQHRDELIDRLGKAIKNINSLEAENASLRAQLKTVLEREAATTARYDAKIEELEKIQFKNSVILEIIAKIDKAKIGHAGMDYADVLDWVKEKLKGV